MHSNVDKIAGVLVHGATLPEYLRQLIMSTYCSWFWMLGFKVNEPVAGEDPLTASFHGGRQLMVEREPDSKTLTVCPWALYSILIHIWGGEPHDLNTSQYCCTGGETLNHNISRSYQVLTPYQMLSLVPLHPLNTGSHYCLRDQRRSRRFSIFPFFTASELPLLGWGWNQTDRLHPDNISKGLHWQPVLKSLRLLSDGLDSSPQVFN